MSQRRKKRRFLTPPPVLATDEYLSHQQAQLETPQRSAVLSTLYFCEVKGIPCNLSEIREVFKVPESTSTDILSLKRARRLQNSDEPNTRGNLRELTNSDVNAIATYIDNAPFKEKGDLWVDLAFRAGVNPPPGKKEWTRQTIQQRVTELTGMKSHKAAIKEDHPEHIQRARVRWCIAQLVIRPHGVDWRCVIWCDELHWATSPRHVKNVKRFPGTDNRYREDNIQYQKDARKDPVKKKWFYIFTVIGYNFAWCIPYDAGNSNGKINARTFLTVLPHLRDAILGKELILYIDCDSAHKAGDVLKWMGKNGMD
ncbi:hypothetical protein BU26DRAFT_164629 [Trematosphaeria pertusa]|uniref:Uncharacterized protein n=1 Tax=Trematosphaeria pertusa TaxID=390896 RepID=A0A6A6HWC8_9PLEO|nr:uncharacterized protein BU26DRAFT_164629 [Trematosphaeria pertusa]KAF2242068.1 hypothetical protein BU26DRAFT_164629 [Trematosphaeria pertusa]